MYEKIKVWARLKLFSGKGLRQTPFVSGYRPLFNFPGAATKISGRIDLTKSDFFYPGNEEDVQITFLKGMINDKFFTASQTFTISEGGESALGEGIVLGIISD